MGTGQNVKATCRPRVAVLQLLQSPAAVQLVPGPPVFPRLAVLPVWSAPLLVRLALPAFQWDFPPRAATLALALRLAQHHRVSVPLQV
jgi:hypothetical protein